MKPKATNPPNTEIPKAIVDALAAAGEPFVLIYGGPKSTMTTGAAQAMPVLHSNMISPVMVASLQTALQAIIAKMNEGSNVASGDGSGQGNANGR